jgi:hypothetical protein
MKSEIKCPDVESQLSECEVSDGEVDSDVQAPQIRESCP